MLSTRQSAKARNWHRRFPRALRGIKMHLEKEVVIELDKATGKHFLRGDK